MDDRSRSKGGGRMLTSSELAAFCLQTSMILKSGIPLHEGLALLKDDVPDPALQAVLTGISNDVAGGEPLLAALERTGVFPAYMVNMVRIGTDAGKLDDVLFGLSSYYEREHSLRQTIRSAVVYPTALVLMMLAVIFVLSVKVLPVFEQVFRGLGTTLSPTANAILQVGLAASRYSVALLVIAVVALGGVILFLRSGRGADLVSRIAARGKLAEKVSMARFTASMSLMLASGLDTEHAMRLSQSVVTHVPMREKIERCIDLVSKETSFPDAAAKVSLFPRMTLRMLSLGFQAGTLDRVMQTVADGAETEIDAALLRRVGLIEPVSIAFLSLLVGVILLSVMLPLMGVMSSIGS